MKIGSTELMTENIGEKVIYIPKHAHGDSNHEDSRIGTISSWNKKYVYVNHGRGTNLKTKPEDLIWG